MSQFGNIEINTPQEEVEVPAQQETFEAQVLVMRKSYKKMVYRTPYMIDVMSYDPMQNTRHVLQSGKFQVKLIPSSIANGKPTLIIEEE